MAPKKAVVVSAGKRLAQKKRVAANGHKLPETIQAGVVLTDVIKTQWRLGSSIGVGGFGEIYSASSDIFKPVNSLAEYVIKVEPHSNGPLFAEMHCYHRIAKRKTIEAWMKSKKLPSLGMPKFIGSGSHEHKGQKYRFMVMERFGSDLQQLLDSCGNRFPLKTVLTLGIQILDILEYIHSREYIHADIKASNLLLGFRSGTTNQVYLVDFGLACRYMNNGCHKAYKSDLRKAHDGTIEFTSRDAHIGAHSRRGDLEILGYNLIHWLCGSLPWEDKLIDCEYVHKQKSYYMDHVGALFSKCFPQRETSGIDAVQKFLDYISKLSFDAKPDYTKCRQLLRSGLKSLGLKDDGKLDFKSLKAIPAKKKKQLKRRSDEELENIGQLNTKKVIRSSLRRPCRPCNSNRTSPSSPTLRSTSDLEDFQWSDYTQVPHLEKPRSKSSSDGRRDNNDIEKLSAVIDCPLDNPTPAMLAVLAKMREKASSPPLQQNKKQRYNSYKMIVTDGQSSVLTPAMQQVIRRRNERHSESKYKFKKRQLVPSDDDSSSDASDDSFHTPHTLPVQHKPVRLCMLENEVKDLFSPFWISEEQRSIGTQTSPGTLRSGACYSP